MSITRQAAKALIKLTPDEVKDICPDFNTDNWDVLVAWADGMDVVTSPGSLDAPCALSAILAYTTDAPFFSLPRDRYTIKSRTIKIGDMEVPEPVREPLRIGQVYWVVDTTDHSFVYGSIWAGTDLERRRIKHGRIQLTKEGAIAQATAEIIASGGTVD